MVRNAASSTACRPSASQSRTTGRAFLPVPASRLNPLNRRLRGVGRKRARATRSRELDKRERRRDLGLGSSNPLPPPPSTLPRHQNGIVLQRFDSPPSGESIADPPKQQRAQRRSRADFGRPALAGRRERAEGGQCGEETANDGEARGTRLTLRIREILKFLWIT